MGASNRWEHPNKVARVTNPSPIMSFLFAGPKVVAGSFFPAGFFPANMIAFLLTLSILHRG